VSHAHVSRFRARSYELDSYRHLNNGVYVNWFEQARFEWLQSLGFSYDSFADRQEWIVVARTEVDFRAPLRQDDEVALETHVARFGRTSVTFRQRMRRVVDGQPTQALVCEALTIMVFTGPGGGSIPIPNDFREAVGPVTA